MSAPQYRYIISKSLDPVFAIAVGSLAAGVRIRREEREKHDRDMWGILDVGLRRVGVGEETRRRILGAGAGAGAGA
ncbi:MAG: hypothetical protein M1819_001588 [Sarea resinae]|nr:MAG: hypothetical protein M1819_001588 [Sarea resinae]